MALVTFKVKDDIRKRMQKFRKVNWSEVARKAVEERLALEESLQSRSLDVVALNRALTIQDVIRSKTSGTWSLSEEIRVWRERR